MEEKNTQIKLINRPNLDAMEGEDVTHISATVSISELNLVDEKERKREWLEEDI